MNVLKTADQGTIRVADITIAQLSRGLYRSTATAFKELVSNAYDADAEVVRIDTNYPEFDFISCVDDGTGMPLEEFLRHFNEMGIGACTKRKQQKDKTEVYNRPIIGRLGIGMLAIGQLCHSFEIESHYTDPADGKAKAYHAEIVLADLSIPDKEKVIRNNDADTKEIPAGTWEYDIIPYDETRKGFRVYSWDVRSTFRGEMKDSVDEKQRGKISFSLSHLHSTFYDSSTRSVRAHKAYLETIWELAILCPLPYYGKTENYPVDMGGFSHSDKRSKEFKEFRAAARLIRDRQQRFLNDNFRVVFDGIELRRHIQLPTEGGTLPRLYFVAFDDTCFDSRLTFYGYLFAQVSTGIKPLELNGVQIRLRGVGIGGYDSTFLRYHKAIATIRSKWVSGEIFVDEGLESALNIDRDSFNEHDEHFKRLQSVLHDKLDHVFDEINAIARERTDAQRDKKEEKLKKDIQRIVAEQSKGRFRLRRRALESDGPIVSVNEDKGEIVLNTAARPLRKKNPDRIIRAVMLAYHAAKRITKDEEEQDSKFYELVKEVLDALM